MVLGLAQTGFPAFLDERGKAHAHLQHLAGWRRDGHAARHRRMRSIRDRHHPRVLGLAADAAGDEMRLGCQRYIRHFKHGDVVKPLLRGRAHRSGLHERLHGGLLRRLARYIRRPRLFQGKRVKAALLRSRACARAYKPASAQHPRQHAFERTVLPHSSYLLVGHIVHTTHRPCIFSRFGWFAHPCLANRRQKAYDRPQRS